MNVYSPKIGLESLLENGDSSKVSFIKHYIHTSSFSLLTTTTTTTTKEEERIQTKKFTFFFLIKKNKHFYKTLIFF